MKISARTAKHPFPLGIGWRPEIALPIDRRDDLSFVEVTAENIDATRIPDALRQLRDRGLAVIPHGVSLSLGGAKVPDPARLDHLATLANTFAAPFVSEHIAFVRAGDVDSGHLLPVQRSRESLEVLVDNINRAKQVLPVPLALENISALFEWPDCELSEPAYVTEVLERTDTLMLLDLANIWANARNFGADPIDALKRFPMHRIAYCHVGGGYVKDGVYHDTHSHPVPAGVLEVVANLLSLLPEPPAIMLERDDHFPPTEQLNRELDAIAATATRGLISRSTELERVG